MPFGERNFSQKVIITIANRIPLFGIWHNVYVPKNLFHY
jgi:hypothetical protein